MIPGPGDVAGVRIKLGLGPLRKPLVLRCLATGWDRLGTRISLRDYESTAQRADFFWKFMKGKAGSRESPGLFSLKSNSTRGCSLSRDAPPFEFGRQRRMEQPRFCLKSASRPAPNVDQRMVADKGREIARRGCHVVASCVIRTMQTKRNPPYRIDKTGLWLVAGVGFEPTTFRL